MMLLYKDGECRQQLVGAAQYGGVRLNKSSACATQRGSKGLRVRSRSRTPPPPPLSRVRAAAVEWVLSGHGVLATDLDEDPRKALPGGGVGTRFGGSVGGGGGGGGAGSRGASKFAEPDGEDD
jgi:hypothetical protein